jgi:hypothetical protein
MLFINVLYFIFAALIAFDLKIARQIRGPAMQNALAPAGLIDPAGEKKTRPIESRIIKKASSEPIGTPGSKTWSIHIAQPALSFGHVSGRLISPCSPTCSI